MTHEWTGDAVLRLLIYTPRLVPLAEPSSFFYRYAELYEQKLEGDDTAGASMRADNS